MIKTLDVTSTIVLLEYAICPLQILHYSTDVKIEELYSPLTLIYLLIIYLDTLYL